MKQEEGPCGTDGTDADTDIPLVHAAHSSPKKALFEAIREALAQGQDVSLPGLGSFSVMFHAARSGRNPRTGERIDIAARRRVHFKMGKGLRALLNS